MSTEGEPPPPPPPPDAFMYDTATVQVSLPAHRFQLTFEEFDFGRFADRKPRPLGPKPDPKAIANFPSHEDLKRTLKEVENKLDDPFWISCWLKSFSKNQIDRDDMRDLLLSKLPVSTLFAVGCVPDYFPYLFNAHINPFLDGQIKHNKEYFPSAFCIREDELDAYGISHDPKPRQIWAYRTEKQRWVSFPNLSYLPPRVNQMLAGEGGLLLLCGDPPPWVDPLAPDEPEPEPEPEPKKQEFEEEEEEEADEPPEEEEEEEGEKEPEPPPPPPPEPRIDPNGQKLIVVCNPVARTFRILPNFHCHLENLLGHIHVTPMSDHYVVYILGYHHAIGQCPEQEGLRVGIFKSLKGKWRVFSLPQGRLYRPGISNYNRALPLISKNIDTTTIFCSAQIITPQEGATVPVILGFKKKTRTWTAYSWPPAHEVEHPQVVECCGRLYIAARGVTQKATLTIWAFVEHEFSLPECNEVTRMPPRLFARVFPYGYRLRAEFDVASSPCTIAFACRDRPTVIACYSVKKDSWYDLPLYNGYVDKLTFLGNWRFEPAAHAQV
jgi:hypothetical protein